MNGIEYIGLQELLLKVQEAVMDKLPERVWLRAEISELKCNVSGHCYLTLVEKSEDSESLLAKVPAIIWASTWRTLSPFFVSETGKDLEVGMTVLVRVQVQYSELYGLSLIISDIDPSFTVGELELQRQRTIARLQEEGMFEMNSTLELPRLPRRFAVISSRTAAGYRDFLRQLTGNEYGYRFEVTLFDAVMQGNDAPESIIAALDEIAAVADQFDAVLIMRGGGGAMDLVCFDDYDLAANVAQFPLPVLTGVGHDHDYHVIDMVAHTYLKTPTALADHIVDIFAEEEWCVDSLAQRLHLALRGKYTGQIARVDTFMQRVASAVTMRCLSERHKVETLEGKIVAASPEDVLKRGFTMTLKGGRRVLSVDEIGMGDELKIMFKDGIIDVSVCNTKKQ